VKRQPKQWVCDGCGAHSPIQDTYPTGWQVLTIKKRTVFSTVPISRGKVEICSTACVKRALMAFWDRALVS
jgi:hypothetical protein